MYHAEKIRRPGRVKLFITILLQFSVVIGLFEAATRISDSEIYFYTFISVFVLAVSVIFTMYVRSIQTRRILSETEREQMITDLQETLNEVKVLSGLLPICAKCKKIRDSEGYWQQIEQYIRDRSDAEFSHAVCRDCAKELYPDIYREIYADSEGDES